MSELIADLSPEMIDTKFPGQGKSYSKGNSGKCAARNFLSGYQYVYDVLCSPNISEGRNKEIIDTCAAAISSVDGVILLDVDPSPANNRTVFNFVGSSSSVVEAALNLARVSYNLIDISKHKGYQPRLGILSECPFVPLRNDDMPKCIEAADEFARKLSEEVIAPVYIYGDGVTNTERLKIIEELLSTEYEELEEKIVRDDMKPDYGIPEFVPQWGATLVGARKFLVYFNINLIGTKEQAVHIGSKLEEIYNNKAEGSKSEEVQCAGWFSDELNVAQISVNIIDYEKTPIHFVFQSAVNIAKEICATVIGSQLVGTVPLSLLTQTANQIMNAEELLILDEDQKIRLVIGKLNLSTLNQFNPKEKVIEYVIEASEEASGKYSAVSLENALLNLTMGDFIQAVSARNSTPGLGSVASLVTVLGTSLATMSGLLSYGKCFSSDTDNNKKLREIIPKIYECLKELLPFIDRHALLAFEYSKISSLTSDTEKDKVVKMEMESKSIERGLECCKQVSEISSKLCKPLVELARIADRVRCSELKMTVSCILTGIEGLLNLADTYDMQEKEAVKADIEKCYEEVSACRKTMEEIVASKSNN